MEQAEGGCAVERGLRGPGPVLAKDRFGCRHFRRGQWDLGAMIAPQGPVAFFCAQHFISGLSQCRDSQGARVRGWAWAQSED